MTREEINEWANRNNNALHCLRAMVEEEVCEECELYGTTGTDHCEADCVRVAIKALEQEPCEDVVSRDDIVRIVQHNNPRKALEKIRKLPSVTPQEQFKPMVEIDLYSVIKQKYIEREVLDKISARIELEKLGYPPSAGYYKAIKKCLQIIDKYKAESEVDNGNDD